jgi:hypothetical protein
MKAARALPGFVLRRLSLRTGLLALPLVAARGQLPPDVRPGARVSVQLPDTVRQAIFGRPRVTLRGTVIAVSADTLTITPLGGLAGAVAVPRSRIDRLWISRGVPSRRTSAFRAGVRGAFLGTSMGYYARYVDERGEPEFDRRMAEHAAMGAGIGLVVGIIAGAWRPVERWKRLRVSPL